MKRVRLNRARGTRRKRLPKNHATGVDQKHTPGQRTETVRTTRKTSQPRTSLLTQPQSQANHPPHTLPMNQARVMTVVQ